MVAGDVRLAVSLGAGVHLRAGRWPGQVRLAPRRRGARLITSSAHGPADLRRAARTGLRFAAVHLALPAEDSRGIPAILADD